jgi:hypothetical protein
MLEESESKRFVTISEDTELLVIAERMRFQNACIALVTDGSDPIRADKIKGVITGQEIGDALLQSDDFFSG